MDNKIKNIGKYNITCKSSSGEVKWEENINNLVVNQGLQHELDVVFQSGTQITSWYVGLLGSSPSVSAATVITDLTEFTAYDGSRKAFTSTRSNQTVGNSASKASFAVNANSSTIGGAFVFSAASGTTGTLFSAAAFSAGNRSAESGDTLEVTYSITATA